MSGLGTQSLEHRPASNHESICEPSTAISVEQPECSIGVTISFSLGGWKDKRLQVRSVACLQGGWLRIGGLGFVPDIQPGASAISGVISTSNTLISTQRWI